MTINEVVLELAALKAFGDHVKVATDRAKSKLTAELRRGTVSAYVGEEDVGTIVVVPDRYGWEVVDEKLFLEWVKANRPTAVVESVRSSDKLSILQGIGKDKAGEVPDGVGRVKATGYVQVKQTRNQRDALLEAAGEGLLPSMPIMIGAGDAEA